MSSSTPFQNANPRSHEDVGKNWRSWKTYRYFMSESRTSEPPSVAYTLFRSGVISAALIDWRTSMTIWSCASYPRISPYPPHPSQIPRHQPTLSTPLPTAPLSAPSASPPLNKPLTLCASKALGPLGGAASVAVGKLRDDSGSSASMSMVRQWSVREAEVWDWIIDIVVAFGGFEVGWLCVCVYSWRWLW